MKTRFVSAVIIMLLGATAAWGDFNYPSLAQLSYEYSGNGARAMAMGNAFVGLADDITGGTWNPAGIWALERPMIGFSYRLYSPKGEFTDKLTDGITKDDINLNGIGQFSFVAPVRLKGHPWVFNFNYNLTNDFTSKERALVDLESGFSPDFFLEDHGYLRAYNFGLSTRIYEKLSMGFNLNVYDGRRVYSTNQFSTRDSILNPLYPESTTVRIDTHGSSLDSTTSSGFNIAFGTLYKTSKLGVGLVVQTPFKMKHTTQRAFFNLTSLNGQPDLNSSDTIYVVDSIAKQDIPVSGTIGLAYAVQNNLHVTMDVNYQKYGGTSWYYRTVTTFTAGGDRSDVFAQEPINWNDSYGIGLGLEFVDSTKFGKIPVRCGFRADFLPEPKNITYSRDTVRASVGGVNNVLLTSTTLSSSDRQKTMAFSLGTGIHWSLIQLDIAYRYTFGGEMVLTNKGNDVANTVQTTKRKAHELKCTFTGYF